MATSTPPAAGTAKWASSSGGILGAEEGHAVVLLEPRGAQSGGQPVDPLLKLAIRVAARAVHHGGLVGEDVGAALEKAYRGELGAVDIALLHGTDPPEWVARQCTTLIMRPERSPP
jgi:hypothetical protein